MTADENQKSKQETLKPSLSQTCEGVSEAQNAGKEGIGDAHNANTKVKNSLNLRHFWKCIQTWLYDIFSPFSRITDVGFFTAVLVIVAWLQWNTLEKTDQTFKAAQRPWLEFSVQIMGGWAWAQDELTMFVKFGLRNTGHSPALNVRGFNKTFLVWDDDLVRKTQEQLCDEFDNPPPYTHPGSANKEEGYGYTIFPDNPPLDHFMIFEIPKTEIDKFKAKPPVFPRPIAVGCFSYFYGADHSAHDTGFMYLVRPRPASQPFMLPTKPIPPNKLDLIPWGSSRIN